MNPTSKIKLPDNSVLDIKDANAGYSIALVDKTIQLKNADGTVISSLQLNTQNTKVKLVYLDDYALNTGSSMSVKFIRPHLVYITDEDDHYMGRLTLYNPNHFSYSQEATTTANLSAGVNSIRFGNLELNQDLRIKSYAEINPNAILNTDSLLGTISPLNIVSWDTIFAGSSVNIYTENVFIPYPNWQGTGKFLYMSDSNLTDATIKFWYGFTPKLNSQYQYNMFANIDYNDSQYDNQIFVSRVTLGTKLNMRAVHANILSKIELYDELTNTFSEVALINPADANPIDDNYYFELTKQQDNVNRIYKLTFTNSTGSFWTLCKCDYKLHA